MKKKSIPPRQGWDSGPWCDNWRVNASREVRGVKIRIRERNDGIVSESDLGWAIGQATRGAFLGVRGIVRFARRVFGRLATNWLAIGAVLVLLYFFWPSFRYSVRYYLSLLYYKALYLMPR